MIRNRSHVPIHLDLQKKLRMICRLILNALAASGAGVIAA
jgi:hypothetical protein